jgi:trans-2,3-dihydro-3-hydroxyanthranilate isomerase
LLIRGIIAGPRKPVLQSDCPFIGWVAPDENLSDFPGRILNLESEPIMQKRMSLRYRVVDVFADCPLEGNPLAVFPSASELDDVTMQRIARELNLSETVFIRPSSRSDCAVSVRIFTPLKEMEFAGHPTVGASFVILEEGLVPRSSEHFVLEEKVGPVPIRVERASPPLFWLTTPPIMEGRCYEHELCAQVLGLSRADLMDAPPQLLSAGNPTVFVALKSRQAVDRAWLSADGCATLRGPEAAPMCVFVFTPVDEGAYSRMFAPDYGIPEDPATGSSTGPLARYMLRHGMVSGQAGSRFIFAAATAPKA